MGYHTDYYACSNQYFSAPIEFHSDPGTKFPPQYQSMKVGPVGFSGIFRPTNHCSECQIGPFLKPFRDTICTVFVQIVSRNEKYTHKNTLSITLSLSSTPTSECIVNRFYPSCSALANNRLYCSNVHCKRPTSCSLYTSSALSFDISLPGPLRGFTHCLFLGRESGTAWVRIVSLAVGCCG